MLGTNRVNQYSLVEASCKKWPKTENDLDDNKYELPIFKYDGNQDLLGEQKEGTLEEEEEEEEEPKTL